MKQCLNEEMSLLEETRGQFNGRSRVIKPGIDVHQNEYVVVAQVEGSNPELAQRFSKAGYLL